ncbi:hypothetical protein [Nonomuraea sp. bgisy101]|uniref:hypothetical protein n=1 Tax=Nonomuraea sp. bgisy101 TaxID=3413784 RepID=UPI003D70EEC4
MSTEESSVDKLDAAEQWLRGYLAGRDGMATEESLLKEGSKAGHADADLRQAGARLGVDAATLAPGTKWSRWWWLPEATYSAEDAQLVGMKRDTWPYGPNIDLRSRVAMVAWAKRHGLRPARSTAPLCLTWLEKGRCNGCDAPRGHTAFYLDHMSGWAKDGVPAVIVNHPYHVSGSTVQWLSEAEARPGLHVSVPGRSWYSSATVQVEVWNSAV